MTADQDLVKDCLESAVAEFETNRMSMRTMRRFATEMPSLFASAGMDLFQAGSESAGVRYLVTLLLKQPAFFQQLADPFLLSRWAAVALARRLMTIDPSADILFARQLPGRDGSETPGTLHGAAAERALDILDEISYGRRVVPILSHLTQHPNHKLSSKAALLIGKRVRSIAWAQRHLKESSNPRVRANAVESVWGIESPAVKDLFWACTKDMHNRVVGNAIVGLNLSGEDEARRLVKDLAHDYKVEFRMTSAWTMGKIGDPDFVPSLSPLIKDEHPGVRAAALRSLQNIRQMSGRTED